MMTMKWAPCILVVLMHLLLLPGKISAEESSYGTYRHHHHLRALQNNATAANGTTTAPIPPTPPVPVLMGPAACAIPLEDAVLPFTNKSESNLALLPFRPSYIDDCYSSLVINRTLMGQHIDNMRATFEQYFCFYDIANNVSDSDPLSYQPELGYTLFIGEQEGQVDIDTELRSLSKDVQENGASLATFWAIRTIFNKLYDAHVTLPAITGIGGLLAGAHVLSAIPERNLDPATRMEVTRMAPSYNRDDGELRLVFEFLNPVDGTTIEESVEFIHDMTPYEFYLSLVSTPEATTNFPYQSIGARMNGAFRGLRPLGSAAFRMISFSRPTDILPDTFEVVYESGKQETFYTAVSYTNVNSTFVHGFVNSQPDLDAPGAAFSNFEITVSEIETAVSAEARSLSPTPKELVGIEEMLPETTASPKPQTKTSRQANLQLLPREPFVFDQIISVPSNASSAVNGRMIVGGIKIQDDYAVLKIQSFDMEFDDDGSYAMMNIWSNFTKVAKESGVTKALIDISFNGGGAIIAGNMLAVSMYPFIPYDTFREDFDITYNEVMEAYHTAVAPVLMETAQSIAPLTDAELQTYLETLPASTYDQLFAIVSSLFSFCCGSRLECSDPRCQEIADLGNAIVELGTNSTGAQLRVVLNSLLVSLEQYSPFNIFGLLEKDSLRPDEKYEVIRGGERVNLTNKFSVFTEEVYNETVSRALQNDFTFDEYLIVSDGAAGSTTCIFSSMVMQLWNNRETLWANHTVSPVPLTTLTYGGTKDPAGTTVAGFPASVTNVFLEVPIIASGLLSMVEILLPPQISETVTRVNQYYQSVLPVPPYFADGLPAMPVYNYYSYLMGPDAIPLQFVQLTADKHLQQVFTSNTIRNSTDLQSLYKQSSTLGFSFETDNESFDENLDASTNNFGDVPDHDFWS